MKTAVRYFTRSGNTQKLAMAMAKALGTSASPTIQPLEEPVDILFLGASIYAGGVDESIKTFIETLTPQQVKKVVLFSTGMGKTSTYAEVEKLLQARSIPLAKEEFHCQGKFLFFNKNRPNQKDCDAAAQFATNLVAAP